ncbi:hypothetical protein Poly51_34260 [Rubripirellula tenax]|uniref:Uncharacterized protein n=1 Tax=Rubripirellula tenax TaxID=2528015 RepID=A0A5C6F2U1_9BACT|nr:hypothetical protein Poly51_34260 [Rubripirellula tenax]
MDVGGVIMSVVKRLGASESLSVAAHLFAPIRLTLSAGPPLRLSLGRTN